MSSRSPSTLATLASAIPANSGLRRLAAFAPNIGMNRKPSRWPSWTKRRKPASPVGGAVGWVVPVVAPVPGGDEGEHALRRHPGGDPAQNLEHPGEVVEHVARVVHPVQRDDQGRAPEPAGD